MNNATEYPAAVRMGVIIANAWLRSFVSNSYYYLYSIIYTACLLIYLSKPAGNLVLLKKTGASLANRSAPGFLSRYHRRFLAHY